jgi:transposase
MSHKNNIIKLRSQGKTYREIQKELGCSKGTISYHLGEGQKQKTRQRSQKRRTEMRQIIATIKEESGCVDCKKKYPYFVLDFDHISGEKTDGIARMVLWNTLEEIYEEISKCEVVCANCHRLRTHKRKGNDRYQVNTEIFGEAHGS